MIQTATPLLGGHSTDGVIKIANTVHRPVNPNSNFIHKLLLLLEEKEYPFSPRFLGIDEEGREVLTYIEGTVPRGAKWSEEQLLSIVRMIRDLHNATKDTDLAGDKEVVCHNDIAPWNTVLIGSKPVSFIDFDDSAPGYRIDDFAYFLWTFLDLGDNTSVDVQAKRIKPLFDEYGGCVAVDLMDALLEQQNKILKKRITLSINAKKQEDREFSKDRIEKIRSEIEWVEVNRREIERYLNE